MLPCRFWSLSGQWCPSRPSGTNDDASIDIVTEIGRNYGSGYAGNGWWCPVNHGHSDSHPVGWVLPMIGWYNCRCRGGRWFRGEVTLMMMRGLLRLMMLRVMVRMLLLWLLVIGHRGRELGRVMSRGAGIYRVVVAFIVHLNTEALKLLPGVSLHRIGLLEARQWRRTANKNA